MFHTFNLNRAAPLASGVRLTSTLARDKLANDDPLWWHYREKIRRKNRFNRNRSHRN